MYTHSLVCLSKAFGTHHVNLSMGKDRQKKLPRQVLFIHFRTRRFPRPPTEAPCNAEGPCCSVYHAIKISPVMITHQKSSAYSQPFKLIKPHFAPTRGEVRQYLASETHPIPISYRNQTAPVLYLQQYVYCTIISTRRTDHRFPCHDLGLSGKIRMQVPRTWSIIIVIPKYLLIAHVAGCFPGLDLYWYRSCTTYHNAGQDLDHLDRDQILSDITLQ